MRSVGVAKKADDGHETILLIVRGRLSVQKALRQRVRCGLGLRETFPETFLPEWNGSMHRIVS
jgi:hypothetical protein